MKQTRDFNSDNLLSEKQQTAVAQLDCNYSDNYYGDQLCQLSKPASICNYDNDYYGDQFCERL